MHAQIIDTDVLIVGGAGCGLTLSSVLSNYGIKHVLVEKRECSAALPKAHYLNQRSMEVLRMHGMTDEILRQGAPISNIGRVAWISSLGGDKLGDRQVFHTLASFGGADNVATSECYRNDAPLLSCNLPQVRLEPLLRKMAEQRNPTGILFGHSLIGFKDEGDCVTATVRGPSDKEIVYRAKYLVGADGGKIVGPQIGVQMTGITGVADMVSVHISADLSEYWDDKWFLTYFINDNGRTTLENGAVVPMGPTWGRHSEEWVVHFGFDKGAQEQFDHDTLIARIHSILKIPDLTFKVHKINHWAIERVIADKFSEGRVFIAGDAAHRHPPNTGLGLNTAIEDANNLGWKLALVLNGLADEKLLQTYDSERRYAAKRNCDWALFSFTNSVVVNAAVGFIKGEAEWNKDRFRDLLEDSEIGATRRGLLTRILDQQSLEFCAHDLELGFKYTNGTVIPDGSVAPPIDPAGRQYTPSTRPGHRLPHMWLDTTFGSKVVSTHDLISKDSAFLVITDEAGDAWIEAAQAISTKHGVKISTAQIGQKPTMQYWDRTAQWSRLKGIEAGGALLVRLDNFVAWRSANPSKRGGMELFDAITSLLSLEERR